MFGKKINSLLGASLTATLIAFAAPANAVLLIDGGPSATLGAFAGGNYVAGSEFTTGSALTIRSLGWLDAEGDGLLFTHRVGLWSATTQMLLASVDVTPTSSTVASANGAAQWFMENIGPIAIGPGTYRVAGLVGPDQHNSLEDDTIGNGVTVSSRYVRTDFPNGGFNYPNLDFSSDAVRATASTDFVNANGIPEPGTITLFGLGLAGLGLARRRKAAA